MRRHVTVAVPVPGIDRLTYRVPGGLAPVRGARVLVPVGGRTMTGCVLDVVDEPPAGVPAGTIKDIRELLDDEPFLPREVVDLALWVADYYMCGAGEALAAAAPPFAWTASRRHVVLTDTGRERAAREPHAGGDLARDLLRALASSRGLPPATLVARVGRHRPRSDEERRASAGQRQAPAPSREGDERASATLREVERALKRLEREGLVRIEDVLPAPATTFKTRAVAVATVAGLDPCADAGLTPRQREALAALRGVPTGLPARTLAARGVSADVLKRLERHGLVRLARERVERDPFEETAAETADHAPPFPDALTDEQEVALARLSALAGARRFHVTLLHGVTGSGKTEVYRRLAALVRDQGRSVLILVPEIALTPRVAALFRRTFGDRVAIQHSGLSDGERHDQWHRIRRGEVDVVVGTRSAVFAPLHQPGLVIVDEEHDTSYKQEETPRYHGRDVAIVRARDVHALVVLGSATPALETYQNALSGRYECLTLTRRVLDRPLADVRVVNMREEYAERGPDVVLSGALEQALADRLAARDQAIVLLNRRGYASAVFCRQCGATLDCPNCSVSLTLHRAAHRARCHYCDHATPVPAACTACGGPWLEYVGFGTERVEAEIAARFPEARVTRVDRDTIRRRGEITRVLNRFAAREIDVLVGTQMIAKGHDFPAVTLVGVISADIGLGLADFRAAERTFQLLTQVAGRAGRGDRPGMAIIQTLFPDHYSIRHARTQEYRAFFEEEAGFRRAMWYPPSVALVSAIVRAPAMLDALAGAGELARALRPQARTFRVLGPAPAPLGKLRGDHRAQIFLKGTARRAMREALAAALASRPDLARRTTVDVDPLSVL